MSRLPITDARTLEKILLRLGFIFVRQKGSHKFYRHSDGRYTTIPHHGNVGLGRPLIREILKQIELSPEEFQNFLNKV
jgi:predicted RNA binding protein YcfA (HicA-like mRNA interferase family)